MELTQKESDLCRSCGECCKWLSFTVQIHRNAWLRLKQYYETRGCKLKRTNFANMEGNVVEVTIMVPTVCPRRTKFGCTDYSSRPDLCKEYDGTKDVLIADKCLVAIHRKE